MQHRQSVVEKVGKFFLNPFTFYPFTFRSEWQKICGFLAVFSAIGLKQFPFGETFLPLKVPSP